ncbi:hypothetical protein EC960932_0829, partial [Escherichia coli 96.0932]
NQLK